MSELLDKQVYVLNEYFKYKFRDSRQRVTQAHEKCAMKMKEKNNGHLKYFLMEGRSL